MVCHCCCEGKQREVCDGKCCGPNQKCCQVEGSPLYKQCVSQTECCDPANGYGSNQDCPPASPFCCKGHCISEDSCCDSDEDCDGVACCGNVQCCPEDRCCDTNCCTEEQMCCNKACCAEELCCGTGENAKCCNEGDTCCNGLCCTGAQECCGTEENPRCCDEGQVCCDQVCCDEGQYCCDGKCSDEPCAGCGYIDAGFWTNCWYNGFVCQDPSGNVTYHYYPDTLAGLVDALAAADALMQSGQCVSGMDVAPFPGNCCDSDCYPNRGSLPAQIPFPGGFSGGDIPACP